MGQKAPSRLPRARPSPPYSKGTHTRKERGSFPAEILTLRFTPERPSTARFCTDLPSRAWSKPVTLTLTWMVDLFGFCVFYHQPKHKAVRSHIALGSLSLRLLCSLIWARNGPRIFSSVEE